jgi:hypothetical protein
VQKYTSLIWCYLSKKTIKKKRREYIIRIKNELLHNILTYICVCNCLRAILGDRILSCKNLHRFQLLIITVRFKISD